MTAYQIATDELLERITWNLEMQAHHAEQAAENLVVTGRLEEGGLSERRQFQETSLRLEAQRRVTTELEEPRTLHKGSLPSTLRPVGTEGSGGVTYV